MVYLGFIFNPLLVPLIKKSESLFPFYLGFSRMLKFNSLSHDQETYTWWFSDLADFTRFPKVCVRCSRPHEGMSL